MAALRRSFRTVGFLYPAHRSEAVDATFDEVVSYVGEGAFLETVGRIAADILARKPAMVLHLGVGMSPFVIGLAALRLAPVQAVSFGHTATTASPVIDHMILPADFVGDPALFTENLVGLPAAAFPYRIRDGSIPDRSSSRTARLDPSPTSKERSCAFGTHSDVPKPLLTCL